VDAGAASLLIEPDGVEDESAFEAALVAAIRQRLAAAGVEFVVTHGFGLDIAVFMRHPSGTRARFIEAKCFSAAAGRIGFGDASGGGTQVEILLRPDHELAILDGAIRWVLMDTIRPHGSPRYVLFDCVAARAAASGRVARGKQNNFRLTAFSREYVTWGELLDRVSWFLVG
jgi:hypothetical protein